VQLHPEVDVPVLQPWAESDRGSHETRGIDTDAVLRDIDAARAELDDAWRPLADGFAALARGHSRSQAQQ
jgi:GMP synthase (glutamine-hydrolysing)